VAQNHGGDADATLRMSPVGDTAAELRRLALEHGIDLRPGRPLAWLTSRGHEHPVLLDALSENTLRALRDLFTALRGDEQALAGKPARPLRPDFFFGRADQLVELDESQHFTTARLRTLDFYGDDAARGFDIDEYRTLCERLKERSDRDFAHRKAVEFPGPHGRQRQRAYFDAVRDFGAPACGHGGVIRVPAPERDAELALGRFLDRIRRRP
jgi:hypothetical protein